MYLRGPPEGPARPCTRLWRMSGLEATCRCVAQRIELLVVALHPKRGVGPTRLQPQLAPGYERWWTGRLLRNACSRRSERGRCVDGDAASANRLVAKTSDWTRAMSEPCAALCVSTLSRRICRANDPGDAPDLSERRRPLAAHPRPKRAHAEETLTARWRSKSIVRLNLPQQKRTQIHRSPVGHTIQRLRESEQLPTGWRDM